jgi:hypothetical protein
MQESSSSAPAEGVAAYIGIDWADQKHDVILRARVSPMPGAILPILRSAWR